MRIQTFIVHRDYVPDDPAISLRDSITEGYGYNEDADDGFTIVIEGELHDLERAWGAFAVACSSILGADDDHYDYWPSAFDALTHLGKQMDELTNTRLHLTTLRGIWNHIVFTEWKRTREDFHAFEKTFSSEFLPRPE